MTTAALVARTELTLLLRSGVTVALLASFAALAVAAAASGCLRAERDGRDRARLETAFAADPGRGIAYLALERGTFAVLPAAPLVGFAVGQSDVHPAHYHVTARSSAAQLAGDQLEHPLVLHAGAFDLLFVILYLYPLLVIGISHDLVASDRANGTLRLLVVQGGTLSAIVRGRVLTRLVFVLLLPLAACLVAAAVVDVRMLSSARWMLWTATAILYGMFWLGLAVFVNARGYLAKTNALVLTAAWLAFVMLFPSFVNLATRVVHPVPSRVQMAAALRQAGREAVAEGSRMLGRFLEDHPSAGSGVEGLRQFYELQAVRDAEVARQLEPVLSTYQQQLDGQARFVSRAQFASPAIVAQLALTDLAGTSGHRARDFADQASRFQRAWSAQFPPDVLAEGAGAPDRLPAFSFREEPIARAVERTAAPVAAMAVAGGVLLALGVRRLGGLES